MAQWIRYSLVLKMRQCTKKRKILQSSLFLKYNINSPLVFVIPIFKLLLFHQNSILSIELSFVHQPTSPS